MRHRGAGAVRVVATALLYLALTGMGGFGGGRDSGQPTHDFEATFVDSDGNHMAVDRVTAGGDVTLEGDLGRGQLRVPFDNITAIRFLAVDHDPNHVRAEVKLRQGEPLSLLLRGSTTFYGQVPGGAFQIRARDLKSVDFVH